MVRVLLSESRCNINASDKDGKTALLHAASRGEVEIARALLADHCDVSSADSFGKTALIRAIQGANFEVVRLRVQRSHHGCNINAADKSGETALMHAINQGQVELVRALLVDEQCNVNARGTGWSTRWGTGRMPLIRAGSKGLVEVVQALLEDPRCDVNAVDSIGETALMHFSAKGRTSIVERLLAANASMEARTHDVRTSLILASLHGHGEVVQCLLDKGANVNAHCQTHLGYTALSYASREGHVNIVRRILDAQSNTNAHSNSMAVPLHVACEFGHEGFVQLFLEAGANVNARMPNGRTPLHRASLHGRVQVIRILLEAHADALATEEMGHAPLYAASSRGHFLAVKALLPHSSTQQVVSSLCLAGGRTAGKDYRNTVHVLLHEMVGRKASPFVAGGVRSNPEGIPALDRSACPGKIWLQNGGGLNLGVFPPSAVTLNL